MRQRASIVRVFLPIMIALSLAIVPVPVSAGVPEGPTTSSELARAYPDRKTSSSDSANFVSYIKSALQGSGFTAEVLQYSSLIRSDDLKTHKTSFLTVSGENVLAYSVSPSPESPIDLLLVAPYDTFLAETGKDQDISYTCRASSALFSLATTFAASDHAEGLGEFPGLAIAFVSGHYQYGTGVRSLLEEITVVRGATVKCAIALGDIDALDSLPVTIRGDTPAGFVTAIYNAAKSGGVPVTVLGTKMRGAWYRATMSPQAGAFSVESMLDGGAYKGEAEVLSEYGIPVITLGTPRNNLSLPLGPSSQGKVEGVVKVLTSLISGSSPETLSSGKETARLVIFQWMSGLSLVDGSTIANAAGVVCLAALLLIFRRAKAKDLSSLALLGGVFLAAIAAHPLKNIWFAGDPKRYYLVLRPYESIFLYIWSTVTLIAIGTFRVVRVRARILELHDRMLQQRTRDSETDPIENGPEQEGLAEIGDRQQNGGGLPFTERRPHANWAGPWGLAVMAAVLLGTSLSGSEMAAPALFSALVMAGTVLIDNPVKLPKPATIAIRLLGAASALSVVLWAGSPFTRDPARIYALSISRFSIEAIAFTASLSVFLACLVSSFMLPAPKLPRRMLKVTLAELTILALLILVGIMLFRSELIDLPARAVMREFFGNEASVSVDVTRVLGDVDVIQNEAGPVSTPRLSIRAMSGTVRVSQEPMGSSWATIAHDVISSEEEGDKTKVVGTTTAALNERPSYYQVAFKDTVLGRGYGSPFELGNLAAVIGDTPKDSNLEVTTRPGYSIEITWWMPEHPTITREFELTFSSSSAKVDVTGRAIYLDRSFLGIRPVAGDTRFVQVTSVADLRAYR